jgi:hypothetical protein
LKAVKLSLPARRNADGEQTYTYRRSAMTPRRDRPCKLKPNSVPRNPRPPNPEERTHASECESDRRCRIQGRRWPADPDSQRPDRDRACARQRRAELGDGGSTQITAIPIAEYQRFIDEGVIEPD